MERNVKFLRREYRKALLPVMLSVLGGTVNTLIDSAFVSRRLDADALAAISLNMPIFLVLCMIGCLFGVGSFVAASRSLGEKKENEAEGYFHTAVLGSVLISILFMIAGIFFSDEVGIALCRDHNLLSLVQDYCRITLIGALPYILVYIPTYFLQLCGKAREMTAMMVIMIATDILFDWLMLYIFDEGIAGAAVASVLSILIATIYGFAVLQKRSRLYRLSNFRFSLFGLKYVIYFGSSSAFGSLMDVVRMYLLNVIIYDSGGASALALWAVINSLLEISLSITSGVPRTAAPMLGIFLGEHDNEGARSLVQLQLKVGFVLSLAFGLLIVIFHYPIGVFFKIQDPVLVPFICLAVSVLLETTCSILGSFYNVAKRVFLSNFVMLMRTFVFALVFARIMLIQEWLIWLFLPCSMGMTLIATLLIARGLAARTKGREHELSHPLLLDDYLEKHDQVKGFSIISSNEGICQASEDIIGFCMEHGMDRKKGTRLGLALEEVMTVMVQKSLNKENDPVDVRIYSIDDTIGVSIMCSGKEDNLFKEAMDNEDEFDMGVKMIEKLAKECNYIYTLGMNILTVEFRSA